MQCFGFSLPLTMSTLVAYIILFFTQGFTNKKDIIAIGHLFYLDKPQGKKINKNRSSKNKRNCFLSTRFKTFNYFINWIFNSMVVKNENSQPCLVSHIRTISHDL